MALIGSSRPQANLTPKVPPYQPIGNSRCRIARSETPLLRAPLDISTPMRERGGAGGAPVRRTASTAPLLSELTPKLLQLIDPLLSRYASGI